MQLFLSAKIGTFVVYMLYENIRTLIALLNLVQINLELLVIIFSWKLAVKSMGKYGPWNLVQISLEFLKIIFILKRFMIC